MKHRHTPLPWKYRNRVGAGLEILAPIPFKANCIEFTMKDGDQPVFQLVAHEPWIQFPPKEWKEMQEANAEFICRACNSHYELRESLEDIVKFVCEINPFCLINPKVENAIKILGKAKGK